MELTIISQRPASLGRVFCQHHIESINTIGVFGSEPFSIRFTNSSHRKVQVKLSLDGTDIITGQVANLDPYSQMWLVEGHRTMELKAWPESTQGGAAFVFSSIKNSVALHTHGDLTAKGIISAAIFTENYISPQVTYHAASLERSKGGERTFAMADPGPAIGAGEYQEQQITSVKGLREPVLSQLIQIRYLWWDDLVQKLQESDVSPAPQYPTGFHGGIDLRNVPRIGESQPPANNKYSRFL